MTQAEFPVLIVGGGVVGLGASLFLERAGVACLLVERHPTTSIHPRARGVNGRSMELLRELGLEREVREAGAKLAPAIGIHRGDNLRSVMEAKSRGGFIARRLRARAGRGRSTKHSPTGPCRCTQDELEPVLLAAARARGVEARLFTELTHFEQDAAGVTCTLLDRATGQTSRVRARYVIAADGARSRTREQLAIPRSTEVRGGHQMNLYFRADLRELVRGREFSMCLVEQPGPPALRGMFAAINNADLWVLHVCFAPERGERAEDFTEARCLELIRKASGMPDLAIELKGALPWESALRIADRYRSGRVFLAGDAAHVMPPWGGFGANTGIQDAHNLAWKVAAVLRRRAGEALLDTYEQERRPVALAVGAIAASMNDARGLMAMGGSPFATLWTLRKAFAYFGVGYGYASEAIALERGRPPGPGSTDLSGRPGTRMPHVWFEPSSAPERAGANSRLSSLDWCGREYVLWLGASARTWAEGAQLATAHTDLPLTSVQLHKVEGAHAARAFGIGERGALLVRPDGFVAWRARSMPPSAAGAAEQLERVLARTLARPSFARAS